MKDEAIRAAVIGERTDLAEILGDLTREQWGHESLCVGWRTREVVAHMTMPFRMSAARFLTGMIRARGNFDRLADRQARADTETMSDQELLAQLRDNIEHPWRPPGGGSVGALSHDVIHGLDITVALGLPRVVPVDRIAFILSEMRERNIKYFGTDLSNVRLEATDLDWTFGDGEALHGRGQDLLLVIAGRRLPDGMLVGEPCGRYTR
jgi:uncharacterized protein (TIGR03083 family)